MFARASLCVQILLKEPPDEPVESTDKFTVNTSFEVDHRRVKIPMIAPLKPTLIQLADEQRARDLELEYKHVVECTIVRVMKRERQLDYPTLVSVTSI